MLHLVLLAKASVGLEVFSAKDRLVVNELLN